MPPPPGQPTLQSELAPRLSTGCEPRGDGPKGSSFGALRLPVEEAHQIAACHSVLLHQPRAEVAKVALTVPWSEFHQCAADAGAPQPPDQHDMCSRWGAHSMHRYESRHRGHLRGRRHMHLVAAWEPETELFGGCPVREEGDILLSPVCVEQSSSTFGSFGRWAVAGEYDARKQVAPPAGSKLRAHIGACTELLVVAPVEDIRHTANPGVARRPSGGRDPICGWQVVDVQRRSRRPAGSGRGGEDHAAGGRGAGGLVDQQEAAGRAVTAVLVVEEGLRRAQPHPADLVESE